MTDIRCPMCGKNNPEEEATCLHCGARMKPMGTIGQADGYEASENPQSEDILASLMREENENQASEDLPAPQASEKLEEQLSDWLDADLFIESAPEEPDQTLFSGSTPQSSPEFDEGSISEWLKAISDDDTEASPAEADEDDWMQELGIGDADSEETLPEIILPPQAEIKEADSLEPAIGSRQLSGTGDLPQWFTQELESGSGSLPRSDDAGDLAADDEEVELPEWFTKPLDELQDQFSTPSLSGADAITSWQDVLEENDAPRKAKPAAYHEKETVKRPAPSIPEEETGNEIKHPDQPFTPTAPKSSIPEWFAAILEDGDVVEETPSAPEQLVHTPIPSHEDEDNLLDKKSWEDYRFDEQEEELPDWFAAVAKKSAADSLPTEASAQTPAVESPPQPSAETPAEATEQPPHRKTWNWLTRKAKKPAPEPETPEATPAVLKSDSEKQEPTQESPTPAAPAFTDFEEANELAQWAVTESGQFQKPASPEPEGTTPLPDWMSESLPEDETLSAAPEGPIDRMLDAGFLSESEEEPILSRIEGTASLPDWMLGEEHDADRKDAEASAQAQDTSEPEMGDFTGTAGLPDWMLVDEDEFEETPQAQPEPVVSDFTGTADLPDWMLADEYEIEETPQTQPKPVVNDFTGTAGLPDWMLADEDEVEETPQTQPEPVVSDFTGTADLPDWMLADEEEIEETSQTQPEPGVSDFTGTADLPDWMLADEDEAKEIARAESQADLESFTDTGTLPDWMLEDDEVSAAAPIKAETTGFTGTAGLPDWMLADEDEETPETAPAGPVAEVESFTDTGTLPDWMLENDEVSAAAPVKAETTGFTGTAGLPDWMLPDEEEASSAEPREEFINTGELPDWLSLGEEILAPEPDLEESAWTEERLAQVGDVNDLLKEPDLEDWFTQSLERPALEEPEEELPDFGVFTNDETFKPTSVLTDWLGAADTSEDEITEEFQLDPRFQIDDWLSADKDIARPQDDSLTEMVEFIADEDLTSQTVNLKPHPGTAELPEWLDDEEKPASNYARPPADEFPDFSFDTNEGQTAGHKAFTAALSEIDFSSYADETISPLNRDAEATAQWDASAFTWTGDTPQQPPAAQKQEPASQIGAAEARELSMWLSEMNATAAIQGDLEKTGPLRGFRGLLTGDPELLQFQPPAVYSNQLRLSETEQGRVKLMEGILASEQKGHVAAKTRQRNPQMILRLVTSLVLITAILLGLFNPPATASGLIPNPPTQVVQFYQLLQNGLAANPGRPVLIVFDTQPAYASELRAYSELVLKYLMENNTRILTFSTEAEGTLIGSGIMREVITDYFLTYDLDTQSMNLGYLPGGGSAVRDFSISMRGVVHGLDVGISGEYVWDSPLTQDVDSIDDFSTVIVITDNLQNARMWIEQTQPYLPETTQLFMIASAQASPMLRPYLHAGQIDGLIGSPLDAVAYATLSNQLNDGVLYWTSYRWALYLMIAVIIGGILYQIALQVLPERDPGKRSAKKPASKAPAKPAPAPTAPQKTQRKAAVKSRRRPTSKSSRRKAVKS